MDIRVGTIEELKRTWKWSLSNLNFFIKNIEEENAEMWIIEKEGQIIGNLFLFKKLDDYDFANGADRCYLCAFRIDEEYQGKGYGSMLINQVVERARELNFLEITIGVEEHIEKNFIMYSNKGFKTKIKISNVDPCEVDDNFNPKECNPFILLMKKLDD